MNKIKLWIKASRAPFLTASLVSVVLGAVIAWNLTGEFHLFKLILTAFGVIFVHSGTNLVNDYFDHKSNLDEINVNHNMFSGGSRVIQDKELYSEIPSHVVIVDSTVSDFTKFADQYDTNYKILKFMNPWLRDTKLSISGGKSYEIAIPEKGYRRPDAWELQ